MWMQKDASQRLYYTNFEETRWREKDTERGRNRFAILREIIRYKQKWANPGSFSFIFIFSKTYYQFYNK